MKTSSLIDIDEKKSEAQLFLQTKNTHMSTHESKPSILNLLKCKCPRCRKGDMFQDKNPWNLKNTMKMNRECPVCGQPLNIEVGFYYGSFLVSYTATVLLSAVSFLVWWLIIGFSVDENRLLYWLAINAVLLIGAQPYFMRVGRTGWLAFFVYYNKNWKTIPAQSPERINEDQEDNW
jgi:uncharacterized protein (DUF983 family)